MLNVSVIYCPSFSIRIELFSIFIVDFNQICSYLIKRILPDGMFFVGYTYAGELPNCAFGFNTHGLAFTLDSVPPAEDEIVTGSIGRNFISRDILEATCIEDAISVKLLQPFFVFSSL